MRTMNIVVDANELFSCIIAKGKKLDSHTTGIFFSDELKLFAPMKLLEELENNKEEVMRKSTFSEYEFATFIELLKLRISFIRLAEFVDKVSAAKDLAPHLKDVQYFALALKLDAKIWSQEKAFKKQKMIDIVSTNDLWHIIEQ